MSVRDLAIHLLNHAARAMPQTQREWIRAMRAECDHIEDDLAASAFALGCVRASYMQRMQEMKVLADLARWIIAGLSLIWAGASAAWVALMIKVKTHENITPADLGADAGTADTLSFILAYPAWQLAFVVTFAELLAVGAIQLFRHRPSAFPLLVLGVGAAALLAFIDAGLSDPGSNRLLVLNTGMMVPFVCLIPVWWLSRRTDANYPS